MINIFIKNLPPGIASEIALQYERLLPIYNRYIDSPDDHYAALKVDKRFDHFMLAFAIFYTGVVIPLREASSCFSDFRGYEGVENIRIGNSFLSRQNASTINKMHGEAMGILNRHRIEERMLLFSDVKEFARNLNQYVSTARS